jgi:excisionase family DNA binding protein
MPTAEKTMFADGFASIREAEDFLSVSRSTIYKLMDSRELPFAKVGKCRRIPWRSLREYAQKCLVGN